MSKPVATRHWVGSYYVCQPGISSLRQSSDSPPSPPRLSPTIYTRPICAWVPRDPRAARGYAST